MDIGLLAIEVVAAITLAVAALVLYLDFGRVHRAFALFLVLRALMDGMLLISQEEGDLGLRLRMYWFIAVPFAALHFCLVYRRRHGRLQQARYAWLGPLLILGLALGFELLYFLDHDLFQGAPNQGPLESFQSIRFLAYAAVAWVFAAEIAKSSRRDGRRALILASIGFALTPLYVSTFELGYALARDRFSWGASEVYHVLSIGLMADTVRRLLHGRLKVVLAGVTLATLALSGATMAVGTARRGDGETMFRIITAITALAVPFCITYALVKHRLFDAEVKLRFAVKGTTVAAFFVATFFVVSKLTESWAEQAFGQNWIIGAVAAGLLLFALTPLQRWADRVANRTVRGNARGSHAERLQIYREQLEIAWADGHLTAKERMLFSKLQERLGISAEEAGQVERSVVEALAAPPRRRSAATA